MDESNCMQTELISLAVIALRIFLIYASLFPNSYWQDHRKYT